VGIKIHADVRPEVVNHRREGVKPAWRGRQHRLRGRAAVSAARCLAAADWVAAGRDELNRLNVFPVPDGDTGTNMCLTLRAVAQALRDRRRPRAPPLPA